MGSEDLFHKRNARSNADLKRSKAFRTQYSRILIVCEGTQTEFNYFRDLRADLGINANQIKIEPNDGNTPDRVVAHALKTYDDDALSGDAFGHVYCVFDRDSHSTFDSAIAKINGLKAAKRSKPFVAITSTPCFEFWLLLHFGYTDTPFHSSGRKSVGDQVVAALKKNPSLQSYGKGSHGIYALLKPNLNNAIAHAEQLRKNSIKSRVLNPSTEIDLLVKAIRDLRNVDIKTK